MSPRANAYNARELAAERIVPRHITRLTRHYQDAHKLVPDGCLGQVTRAHLDAASAGSALAMVALEDVGKDRRASDVPLRVRQWCAWGVAQWLRCAALPAPPPGSRDELGAKRLLRWLLDHGATAVWRPGAGAAEEELAIGDVVCWDRGPAGWMGHTAVLVAIDGAGLHFVGPNESGRVRCSVWGQAGSERPWTARMRGVYAVAHPV